MWRAIENKRYLLRATNTGWTTVIDPLGKIIDSLPAHQALAKVIEVKKVLR
jgi:apolipoprotein N-acyltransferase